jgi:stage II sporulation protein AA (anti-sigma F factor antagonist)
MEQRVVIGDGVELEVVDGRPTIRGECDLATARRIEAWLATFDSQPLDVDLSGVTFFDSASLRAFLNVRRRNPHMRVVKPSKAVRKVLEITGTVEYLVDGRDIFS